MNEFPAKRATATCSQLEGEGENQPVRQGTLGDTLSRRVHTTHDLLLVFINLCKRNGRIVLNRTNLTCKHKSKSQKGVIYFHKRSSFFAYDWTNGLYTQRNTEDYKVMNPICRQRKRSRKPKLIGPTTTAHPQTWKNEKQSHCLHARCQNVIKPRSDHLWIRPNEIG